MSFTSPPAQISAVLSTNQNGAKSHSVLHRFLGEPAGMATRVPQVLHVFLPIIAEDIMKLKELRFSKVAPTVPQPLR